jgi:hypothetical protein
MLPNNDDSLTPRLSASQPTDTNNSRNLHALDGSSSCMDEVILLDAETANRLCEDLWESVGLGPGVQNALFALPDVHASIERLRGEIGANDVRQKLLEVERLFEKWFSDREWRGHDQGRSLQRDLYTKIKNLRTNVKLWYSSGSSS